MENHFIKITNKTFAAILTVLFVTTLIGIFTKRVYWHIPTLVLTGIPALALWLEKDTDTKDQSPI